MNIGKTILIILITIVLLSIVFYILTPNSKLAEQTYQKIDSLNNLITKLEEQQKHLDSNIVNYNNRILSLDSSIDQIRKEKTTIKEIYHEKIINVDNFSNTQIDKFFTERYYSTGN